MTEVKSLLFGEKLIPTTTSRNMVLFNISASKELLKICRNKNVGLLGIEGFKLKGHLIEPQMDFIADFSQLTHDTDFIKKSIDAAEKFLELAKNQEDLLFEYILN
jgi:hypothetical protein